MTQRKRPTPPQNRPSPNATNGFHEFTAPRSHGWSEPLTADERCESAILAAAYALGYRLSVRCLDCHRPLTDPTSVARHRGPTCLARAKAVANA